VLQIWLKGNCAAENTIASKPSLLKAEVCPGNGFKHGLIIKGIAAVHRVPQPDPANTNFISVLHLINSHKFMAS
jgi:hypothetical protein